jgi:hypothetical protein
MNRREWAANDIHELESLAKKATVIQIAAKLGRTESAVRQKAMTLGISLKHSRSFAGNIQQRNQDIVERYAAGETLASIGEDLGVSRQRVQQIIKNPNRARATKYKKLNDEEIKNMKVTGEIFKIERDVPLPLTLAERMPLEEMEVGDSFFAAVPEGKNYFRSQIASAITTYSRNTQRRFTVRKVDGGVRVWRIEDDKEDADVNCG